MNQDEVRGFLERWDDCRDPNKVWLFPYLKDECKEVLRNRKYGLVAEGLAAHQSGSEKCSTK